MAHIYSVGTDNTYVYTLMHMKDSLIGPSNFRWGESGPQTSVEEGRALKIAEVSGGPGPQP